MSPPDLPDVPEDLLGAPEPGTRGGTPFTGKKRPVEDSGPDPAQRDKLVEDHVDYARALTHKIARRLPASVDFDELVGYALQGLVEAANKYRADVGVAFTTFSYYRIRGAVFDGLRKMTWLPPEVRNKNSRDNAVDELVSDGLGQTDLTASAEELAKEFRDAVKSLGAVFLLSEASEEGELEPSDETSAADVAEKRDMARRVREALGSLAPEDVELLTALYFEGRSMTEVAAERGVNKSTVCRAHRRAIEELRERFAP